MSGIVNGLNDFFPAEILCEIFKYSDFSNHSKTAQVCKTWNRAMQAYLNSPGVCAQLINQFEPLEIKKQAERFLSMVPHKLEAYCAGYAQKIELLKERCHQHYKAGTLTKAKDLHLRLKDRIEKPLVPDLTEILTVYYSGIFKVDPKSDYIPKGIDGDLRGKVFVKLRCLQFEGGVRRAMPWILTPSGRGKGSSVRAQIQLFPIELFHMKINNRVIEKQDNEIACIVFEGRLIELRFDKKVAQLKSAEKISNDVVQPITLGSEESYSGTRPQDFYIPRLHATPRPSRYGDV